MWTILSLSHSQLFLYCNILTSTKIICDGIIIKETPLNLSPLLVVASILMAKFFALKYLSMLTTSS